MQNSSATLEATYTAEDLLWMENDHRYELLDGRLVEKQMGAKAARVALILGTRMEIHAAANHLGLVFPGDAGYQIFGARRNRVRKPDLSFICTGRLLNDDPPEGHVLIPPDLAVEVISPNDLAYEVEQKIAEYLEAGIRLLWFIYPPARSVYVIHPNGQVSRLTVADTLTGEDVLPGFVCPVADLFWKPEAQPPATS